MFYYYQGDVTKKYNKKYLEGWRKKDIISFRDSKAPWLINVGEDIEVIIFPHFLESLAESINMRGLVGGFDFYEKKLFPIDRKTSQPFVDFYMEYQSQVNSPLPPEAFGIILTCLSYSPFFYYQITKWETTHPTEIQKWEDKKIDSLLDNLASDFDSLRQKAEKEWNESKDELVRYFEYHSPKITKKRDRDKLNKKYIDKIEKHTGQLEVRLIELDTLYQSLKNSILDSVYYPSFVFKINGFYVVTAKMGHNQIRLRTIYGNADLPRNTFVSDIELSEVDILPLLERSIK